MKTIKLSKFYFIGKSKMKKKLSSCCYHITPSHGRAKNELVQKSKKTAADYEVDSKYKVANYDIEL